MSSPAQPILDWRNKLQAIADKLESWDKPAPEKKPAQKAPLAKDLGWADQTNMRKLTPEGPKLGQKKKPAKKKATATARKKP